MIKKGFAIVDDLLSVIALSGITILTIVNVICRFVLNSPIAWVEEVTLGLFIWLVFIGISSAMKRGGHVGVDYFLERMPKFFRILFTIIGAFAVYFVLLYILVYYGINFAMQASGKLTPVLGINYQYINIAVPLGGLLTAIHFTIKLISSFRNETTVTE
jgi:TRAP-type C4-dicarboxylate transport system permease small subunit